MFILRRHKAKIEKAIGRVGRNGYVARPQQNQPRPARPARAAPVARPDVEQQRRVLARLAPPGVEYQRAVEAMAAAKTVAVTHRVGVHPLAQHLAQLPGVGGKEAVGQRPLRFGVEDQRPRLRQHLTVEAQPGVALVVEAGDDDRPLRADLRAVVGCGKQARDKDVEATSGLAGHEVIEGGDADHLLDVDALISGRDARAAHQPGVDRVEGHSVALLHREAAHDDAVNLGCAGRIVAAPPVGVEGARRRRQHLDGYAGAPQLTDQPPRLGLGPARRVWAIPGRDKGDDGHELPEE